MYDKKRLGDTIFSKIENLKKKAIKAFFTMPWTKVPLLNKTRENQLLFAILAIKIGIKYAQSSGSRFATINIFPFLNKQKK